MKKTIQQYKDSMKQSQLYGQINKTDKTLVKLTKRKRENPNEQIHILRGKL